MRRKKYLTGREKLLDFVIGFIGFFVPNVVIYFALAYLADIFGGATVGRQPISKVIAYVALILPWAINIGLLLFFAWWRPWIALGALSALGYIIVLAILAGVCLVVGCFLLVIGMAILTEILSP